MRSRVPSLIACCLLSGAAVADDTWSCRADQAATEPAVVATKLQGVPALVRIPARVEQVPIVLWHGFGPPASERALMEALPLDEVPAVKVYLGLPMFGERALAGGVEELARRQKEDLATLVFEPAVIGAAKELPAVVDALRKHQCLAADGAIGLFGFSAGGAAALFALAEDTNVRLDAVVTLNASTGLSASVAAYERATKSQYVWTDRSRELARHSDVAGRAKDIGARQPLPALLLIHGQDDAMLNPLTALGVRDSVQWFYMNAGTPQKLRFDLVPGLAHGWVNTPQLEPLRTSIGAWFHTHLSSNAASLQQKPTA